MWFGRLVLAVALLTCGFAEEVKKSDKSDLKKSFGKECDSYYSLRCLKLDIVDWVDKLNEKRDIGLVPGISIVRENTSARSNNENIVAEIARDFPNNPDSRLDIFLVKKVQDFLSSHSLKLNLYNDEDNAVTGRGKGGKKGGGGMGMILAAAAMMKSTYFALALGALAALAGKALMTALISLLLSAILGLKSLTSGGGSSTYEVISKPVYTHSGSHSSGHEDYHYGGHGRSYDVPLPLGLQPEYKPA